ncbi:MAG: hypothetical protein KatS3mg087_1098 [Patescibacteria group bacterium]|nr:MAG: hypothetical protein KatS3mg087_1098 [Patescibacteria group bacterium]
MNRNEIIGASEVPAICGLSPWQSCYDVWAEKVGLMPPKEENEYMTLGKILEPALLDYVSEEISQVVETQKVVQYDKFNELPLLCTLDGWLEDGTIVEVKTSGLIGPKNPGKQWTLEEVPDHVWVQVQTQLFLTKAPLCHVVALIGGLGLMHYQIEKAEGFDEYVLPILSEFWSCVQTKTPPESKPTIDTIKRIAVTDNTMIELSEDTEEYEILRKLADLDRDRKSLKDELDAVEKEIEECQRILYTLRPTIRGFSCVVPGARIELYKTQYTQTRIDVKSLRKEQPEIANKYSRESTITRFNIRVIDMQRSRV